MKLSLLIKPASSSCPGDCSYCFYKDTAEKRKVNNRGIMSQSTLDILLEKAFFRTEELTLAFQGGEPLLAGMEFYEYAFEKIKKKNKKSIPVYISLQTSGRGMTEEFAHILQKNGVLCGVSLDGRAPLNDKYRGTGSHKAATSAIEMLKGAGCEVNVLAVVTRDSCKRGGAIYDYFRSLGVDYAQFIPCMYTDRDPDAVPDSGEYMNFLCDVFDLWARDIKQNDHLGVRMFDGLLDKLCGYPSEACGSMGVCGSYLTVEADGDVYPCDFYCDDGHLLGNIRTHSVSELLDGGRAFTEESLLLHPDCRECRYYALCRGDCKKLRKDGKYIYCTAIKGFLQRKLKILETI